eukprot:SAG22_NODE_178_length_16142_cov_13.187995_17_plen_348_part_00
MLPPSFCLRQYLSMRSRSSSVGEQFADMLVDGGAWGQDTADEMQVSAAAVGHPTAIEIPVVCLQLLNEHLLPMQTRAQLAANNAVFAMGGLGASKWRSKAQAARMRQRMEALATANDQAAGQSAADKAKRNLLAGACGTACSVLFGSAALVAIAFRAAANHGLNSTAHRTATTPCVVACCPAEREHVKNVRAERLRLQAKHKSTAKKVANFLHHAKTQSFREGPSARQLAAEAAAETAGVSAAATATGGAAAAATSGGAAAAAAAADESDGAAADTSGFLGGLPQYSSETVDTSAIELSSSSSSSGIKTTTLLVQQEEQDDDEAAARRYLEAHPTTSAELDQLLAGT